MLNHVTESLVGKQQGCVQTAVMTRAGEEERGLCVRRACAHGMQSLQRGTWLQHMYVRSQAGCIVPRSLIINRSHCGDFMAFPVLLIQKKNALVLSSLNLTEVFIGWLHEHTFVMGTCGQAA